METLEKEEEEEEEQKQKQSVDRLEKKISFPSEIIEDILLRLPVRSILRFRSVSKPWLSLLSHPSFATLHFTRPRLTSLFIVAYDYSACKRHYLSASLDGGPLSHLMSLDHDYFDFVPVTEQLNGLVFITLFNSLDIRVFVLNPSTRNTFMLPHPTTDFLDMDIWYFFGFDESTNEHKIVKLRKPSPVVEQTTTVEVMIFSMSTYSWEIKIDVEPPLGFTWDLLDICRHDSVCVNSVVHLLLLVSPFDILAFDLTTLKFSIINTPRCVPLDDLEESLPYMIKYNGSVAVVYDFDAAKNNEMHIWILQDYYNRVWVKETIRFPTPWIELGRPFPLDAVNEDEIIFSSSNLSGNVMSVPVYNTKRKCFKSLQFTLGHQIPLSGRLEFKQIMCYVESMVPF